MQKINKVVIVTGGFDPIHSGHIEYFKAAKELGDILVVGLNSDNWLARKKGQPFMPLSERMSIVEILKMVDYCVSYNDQDGSSIEAIKKVREAFPNSQIIFANGGDRSAENIPEMTYKDDNLIFEFGVGGENKKNSSSWILEEWKHPKTYRSWGWYRVLDDKPGCKVKELIIEPGKQLSLQRHFKRSEHWFILKGQCDIRTVYDGADLVVHKDINDTYMIGPEVWHQGQNNSDTLCHILEVQYGAQCIEDDIERK